MIETLLFITIGAVVGFSIIVTLSLVYLFRKQLQFIEQQQTILDSQIKKAFKDDLEKHLESYLRQVVPDAQSLKTQTTQKIETTSAEVIQELAQSLKQTADTQLKDLQEKLAQLYDSAEQDILQSKKNQLEAMEEALKAEKLKKLDSFETDLKQTLEATAGDILRRKLTIDDHTKILKEQLINAQEFYER